MRSDPASGRAPVAAGFTLIEILAVMTLLGLTISVVIPNIGKTFEKIKFRSEAKKVHELVQRIRFQAFYYQRRAVIPATDSRLTVLGLEIPEGDIPELRYEVTREIVFSPNGVTSGGEIGLYFRGRLSAVIRIDTLRGKTELRHL